MKRVKFNRSCAPYSTGEIAMFADDKAQAMVDKGQASYVKKEEPDTSKKIKRVLKSRNRMVSTND